MSTDAEIEDELADAPQAREQTEKQKAIVKQVKVDFRYAIEWEATARNNFDYDYKFANGDTHNKYQWDNEVLTAREGRPILTVNKTQQHNLMIVNDAKQNKPGVRIRPVGDQATYEAAQIFQEIVYHIEYISNAENIYDSAMTWAVEAGIGYWQVVTEPISIDTFDQEIKIRRIKDPRSVLLDPDINEVDGSDARWGLIFEDMYKSVFKETYPEFANIVGTQVLDGMGLDAWMTKNHIRVCKYYRKEQKKDKLVAFLTDDGMQIQKRLSLLSPEEKMVYKEVKRTAATREHYQYRARDVLTDFITCYTIAGDYIVDEKPWLGKYVPIVRLPGTETVIDGVLDRKGHTRALINAQQIYNYNTPLALDTPLPTPFGWTTMGETNIGDWLFDENGIPVQVVGMSPVMFNKKCYEVEFDDGSTIVADEDHLWTIEEKGKLIAGGREWLGCTRPTKELKIGKNHFIDCAKSFYLEDKKLMIHPYILGAWLGDGTAAANCITSGISDMHEMQSIIAACNYGAGDLRMKKDGSAATITIHCLREQLVSSNLLNNKHIPKEYLRASREQRLALLQGLMDTDGHIHKKVNQCIFITTDHEIADGFSELLRTLSIKAKYQYIKGSRRKFPNNKEYDCKDFYRFTFSAGPEIPVFKLNRKAIIQNKARVTHDRRTKRYEIVGIKEVTSVPVKCVTINSKSHLFLAGKGMVPTHNSANTEFGALQTKVPWIVPAEAIGEYASYWDSANTKNHAYLPYVHIDEDGEVIPPPSRPQAPQPGPAYVEGLKIAQNEMMMASGQYQAQFGEAENAKSGVAINARQRQGDRATYHFINNQAIAIRSTGKIIIDLIPKIYDTPRIMRIDASDGSILNVDIQPDAQQPLQQLDTSANPGMDKGRQIKELIFNPNIGMYDVQADTGPSFATKRMEAAAAFSQLAATDKTFMERYADLYFSVLDFPKADLMAERAKKFLPPGITGDAPDPQTEQLMHQASDHIQKLTAENAELQRQLKEKMSDIQLKAGRLDLDYKKAGAQEVREDYKANNERLVALGNSGPGVSQEQIYPLVLQTIREMIQDGHLDPATLAAPHTGGTPIQLPPEPTDGVAAETEGPSEEAPPAPVMPAGARLAPDGHYYVEHQPGRFARVEANA